MRFVLVVVALTLLSGAFLPAFGQTPSLQCQFASGVPPSLRHSGIAELMADIVGTCIGTGAGAITTDITLQYNFPVTSRNYAPGSEAILLIDEPNSARLDGPPTPLTPGVTLIQAASVAGNVIQFKNVRLQVPAANESRSLRITNVRGDMTGIAPTVYGLPPTGNVNIAMSGDVSVINPKQTAGYVLRGLRLEVLLPTAGTPPNSCTGRNQALSVNPLAAGGSLDYALHVREGFVTAFKVRRSNGAQDIPGVVYNTESGFYDESLPGTSGLNKLGLADFGTRISLTFRNIPDGARVYVTTGAIEKNSGNKTGAFNTRLVSGNTPVAPTTTASWESATYGIAPLTTYGGVAVGEWEITDLEGYTLDDFIIGVLLAYPPALILTAPVEVQVSFAPLAGTQVPRFSPEKVEKFVSPAGPCVSGVDLRLTNAVGASSLSAGTSDPVRFGVVNRGTLPSGSFKYTIQLLDTSTPPQERARYEGVVDAGLQPGEGKSVTANIRLPLANARGEFIRRVSIDLAGTTGDINRANNSTEDRFGVYCSAPPRGNAAVPAASASIQWYDLPLSGTPGCTWYATTAPYPSWLRVLNPGGGIADDNLGPYPRSTYLCSNSATPVCASVVQAGADAGCVGLVATPSTYASASPYGETRRLTVQTSPGCRWSAVSNARMAAPDGGVFTGPQIINLLVRPNFSTQARSIPIAAGTWSGTLQQAGNPRPLNQRIVQLTYYYFLGRMPSEAEIAFQSSAMNGVDPEDFIPRFLTALEFDVNSRYIAGLYVGLLARKAEYDGFMYQRDALLRGIVSNAQLVDGFLGSPEWKARFGTPDNAGFARLLYQHVLLREPTQAEVDFQAASLSKGVSRTQLASTFLNTQEFRIGTGPDLTAFLLYAAVLGREAAPVEFDAMVASLKAGTSVADAMRALIASPEFAAIIE